MAESYDPDADGLRNAWQKGKLERAAAASAPTPASKGSDSESEKAASR